MNSSVTISQEDLSRIHKFIEDFEKRTGFKISVAQFVKNAISEKLKGGLTK